MLDPAYDSYEPAVTLAGGRVVHVPLRRPDFSVDWQAVRDAITARTRLLIVNSPHNPSGAVFSAEPTSSSWPAAARLAECSCSPTRSTSTCCSTGAASQPADRHPELAERSFVVSSFGKTYHATGWKVGYCIAPAALTDEFRKVHQFVQFAVATPLQAAIADFLVECPAHPRELPAFYQRKRDYFARLLGADAVPVRTGREHVFPAGRLLGHQRRARCRICPLPDDRERRRRDSDFRVLRTARPRANASFASALPSTRRRSTRPPPD